MCWAPTAWTTALERAWTSSCRLPAPPLTPSCITSSCRFFTAHCQHCTPYLVLLLVDSSAVPTATGNQACKGLSNLMPAPGFPSHMKLKTVHCPVICTCTISVWSSPTMMIPACLPQAPIQGFHTCGSSASVRCASVQRPHSTCCVDFCLSVASGLPSPYKAYRWPL